MINKCSSYMSGKKWLPFLHPSSTLMIGMCSRGTVNIESLVCSEERSESFDAECVSKRSHKFTSLRHTLEFPGKIGVT